MSHAAVVIAVEARIKANFARCPIVVENETVTPPADGGPYLTVQFPWSTSEWHAVEGPDGSIFREEGAFRFVLSVAAGAGAHEGRQWLGEIADTFRAARFSEVQCFAPDAPVGDDRNDVGAYYRLAIVVPYEFYFTSQEQAP